MLEMLGDRQKRLVRLLLQGKQGRTVEELSKALGITRNAVRQHLAALEGSGLVAPAATRPSGGRPHQLYALTPKGLEAFPRHYSWFAQLVAESIRRDEGSDALGKRLAAIGTEVGKQLRTQNPGLETRKHKVVRLAALMGELGYEAKTAAATGSAEAIEADNCVFHDLAANVPETCRFDLALLETFTDSRVEHEECMVRGGTRCRFRFLPKKS